MNPTSKSLFVLLLLASAASVPRNAAAQTVTWTGSDDTWTVPGDWSGGILPGSGTNALIDSGTANLPVSVSGAVHSLVIGESGAGVLTITGGSLFDSPATLGDLQGSSGIAAVSGGTWVNSGTLIVGNSGTGTLNISGGFVTGSTIFMALNTGGAANVAVTGGTLSTPRDFSVLGGNLLINGGYVSDSSGWIETLAPSGVQVTVQSGTWNNSQNLLIYDNGSLLISGGYVNDQSASIGYDNYSATVTIEGGTWNNAMGIGIGLGISKSGTGTLDINGGVVISSTQGEVGAGGCGVGVMNVTSGSYITSGLLLFAGSSGSLNLSGGYISDGGVRDYSSSSITVAGGTWANGGAMELEGTSFNMTAGYLSAPDVGLASGTLSGGTWANSGTFDVWAGSGTNTFLMNGGMLSAATSYIGYSSPVGAVAAITGGTWSTGGSMIVGYYGSGTLTISGSGVVEVGSGTGAVVLASGSGSTGVLNIGAGGATGTLFATAISGGNGTAMLNFDSTGTSTFAPLITGRVTVNQTGSGTTVLTGSETYSGATTVSVGTLRVNGSIASSSGVAVSSGATLAGSGVVGNISGAGAVAPGGSAILTASQVDPSSGMSFDFHFSQAGSPTYSNSAASGNDVLHLTGATPFVFSLTSANTITLDFTGQILQAGEIFYGGFFTDAAIADSMVDNATFDFAGQDGATVQFEGMAPATNTAFASGTVASGEVMEVKVTATPVPAVPAWALLAMGAGLFIVSGRRVNA